MTNAAASPVNWPAGFPEPVITPHDLSINMGISRVKMQAGNYKQRRYFKHMPTVWNIRWQANSNQMLLMVKWIHSNGFDWFNIPLVSMWSSENGELKTPTAVRLTSNVEIVAVEHNYFDITATVELSPDVFAGAVLPSYIWIVGQEPQNPATPDWYIGETPAAPSTDVVIAGTPAAPNAYV